VGRWRDEAVVLRSIDWSETSQIVVLFTLEHGKVRGLSKGSKRLSPSSIARFSGGIDLLQLGQVTCRIQATAELANITEWDLSEPYPGLRQSLRAWQLAMYGAELADALLPEMDPHPRSFEAMSQLLANLSADASEAELAILRFQWAMIEDAGLRPELFRDVHELPDDEQRQVDSESSTNSKKNPVIGFDPEAGGITRRQGVSQWRVRRSTISLLQKLSDSSESESEKLSANDSSLARANRLLCSYLRHVLGKELHTMSALLNQG